jgi:hypothetical protein
MKPEQVCFKYRKDLEMRNISELQVDWRSMSTEARQAKGYFPNEIFWPKRKDDARVIIGSRRSARGDFAINETALRRVSELENTEVWLAEIDGTLVNRDTTQNVLAKLANRSPLVGRFGSYWWVDRDFNSPNVAADESAPI